MNGTVACLAVALAWAPLAPQDGAADAPATIAGRMVDADGQPLAGIAIEVLVARENEAHRARTDAAGRFAIPGLRPLESFRLHAHGAGWVYRTPRAALFAYAGWLPVPGERFDLGDIAMERAAEIAGRVLWPDGTPCAGAAIDVVRDGERELDPGSRTVALANALQPLWEPDGIFVRSFENGFHVQEPPFAVPRARPERMATRTSDDGAFRVADLQPGPWLVVIQVRGRQLPQSVPVELGRGARVDLGAVVLRAGRTVEVHVVDERGSAVPRAQILVVCPHGIRGFEQAGVKALADAQGRLALGGYPAAHVTFGARRAVGDEWQLLERASAEHAQTLRLAQLPDPDVSGDSGVAPQTARESAPLVAYVRGRIHAPPDAPFSDWCVVLTPLSEDDAFARQHEAEAAVAADGTFQSLLTAQGPHGIAVLPVDWRRRREPPARIETQGDVGVVGEPGKVALLDVPVRWRPAEPFARVRGAVRVNGAPGAALQVCVLDAIPEAHMRTDRSGRFAFDVFAEEVSLELGDGLAELDRQYLPHRLLLVPQLQLRRGEERDVSLDLRAGSLGGRVVDPARAPVFGARVELWRLGEQTDGGAFVHVVTDDEGRFALPLVPAGDYTVIARWGSFGCGIPVLTIAPERAALRQLALLPALAVNGKLDVLALGAAPRDVHLTLRNAIDCASLDVDEEGHFTCTAVPQGVYVPHLQVGDVEIAHRDPILVQQGAPTSFEIVFDVSYLAELELARRKR